MPLLRYDLYLESAPGPALAASGSNKKKGSCFGKFSRHFVRRKRRVLMLEFGFDTRKMNFSADRVKVCTLPGLEEKITQAKECTDVITASSGIKWFFSAPPKRYFSLPRTHAIEVKKADSEEHEQFHVNALSFFRGLRYSHHECNGYIDTAPMIVDRFSNDPCFSIHGCPQVIATEKSEKFWQDHKNIPNFPAIFETVIYNLFFSQVPWLTNSERFNQTYGVFESYWKLFSYVTKEKTISHSKRWKFVIDYYGLSVSEKWVEDAVSIRNELEHESMIGGRTKWQGHGEIVFLTHSMQRLINILLILMIVGKESVLMPDSFFCQVLNIEPPPFPRDLDLFKGVVSCNPQTQQKGRPPSKR